MSPPLMLAWLDVYGWTLVPAALILSSCIYRLLLPHLAGETALLKYILVLCVETSFWISKAVFPHWPVAVKHTFLMELKRNLKKVQICYRLDLTFSEPARLARQQPFLCYASTCLDCAMAVAGRTCLPGVSVLTWAQAFVLWNSRQQWWFLEQISFRSVIHYKMTPSNVPVSYLVTAHQISMLPDFEKYTVHELTGVGVAGYGLGYCLTSPPTY